MPEGAKGAIMRAMVLRRPGEPLVLEERPAPEPGPHDLRLRVEACGVCRTDLHVVDGELPHPKLPDRAGPRNRRPRRGDRTRRARVFAWRKGRRSLARQDVRVLFLLRRRP